MPAYRRNHDKIGALFRRRAPTPGEGLPSYRGELLLEGVRWRLEGFLKRSKAGALYMQLMASKAPAEVGKQRLTHGSQTVDNTP